MHNDPKVEAFFSKYDDQVFSNALKLREILFANLPDIIEQIDVPAKMVAYCYGQKYAEMICIVIPSKKGLKLAFNRGVDLADPENLLEGKGKISRYIEIKSAEQIDSPAIRNLLSNALKLYHKHLESIIGNPV